MLGKQIQPIKSTFFSCKCVKFPFPNARSLQTTDGNPATCIPPFSTSHQDIISLNKLITSYAKAGDLVSAHKLFDDMPQRDVVSWNCLMSGYAQHEYYDKVLHIFSGMRCHGLVANHTSISTVLSACAVIRAFAQGKKIHGLSVKTCSTANVFVGTSLITMYSKCGAYDCLLQIFHDIDCPNIASQNALISGFVLNLRMDDARLVFDLMPERNVVSWTAMIHGYTDVKKVSKAMELFNLMPVKNSVTWSIMVGGLARNGMYEDAIRLFNKMIRHGVRSTTASVINVLIASSGLKNVKQGRKFHGLVVKAGFLHCESIEATLVSMYCACLDMEEAMLEFRKLEDKFVGSCNALLHGLIRNETVDKARVFFDSMKERNKISWNLMISGYVKDKRRNAAFELYSSMHEPTIETTTALMMSFIQDGRLNEAHELFSLMRDVDVVAYTTLIFGYLEYGLPQKAMEIFRKMPEHNIVTHNVMIAGLLRHGNVAEAYNVFSMCPLHDNSSWDALITGFVQNGLLVEAFLLYKKMLLSGLSPSELIMATLLSASSKLSVLINGTQIHPVAIKLGHDSHLVVGNALLNMYCKFGEVLIAQSIFDQMMEKDVMTWNVMIFGYAFIGFGKHAMTIFEDMRIANIKPDNVTFLGLLSACTHMGLFEKAQYYFNLMRQEYAITPDITHYSCMIDLVCRMGMVEQAERLISSMPFQPDSKIWSSILSGCRFSSNVRLAKQAANQLLIRDPGDPTPFLHLINVYSSAGKLEDLETLRKQMFDLCFYKPQGCSWI